MRPEREENPFFGLRIINGISKFSKFMSAYFSVLLLFIAVGCSAKNSAKMTSVHNENADVHNQNSNLPNKNVRVNEENSKNAVVKNGNSKNLDCNEQNGYSLIVVKNPNRKHQGDITPEDVNIVVGDEVVAKIELPNAEVNNFVINSAEKTEEGFEIKAEWGLKYHYDLQYNFRCKEDNFYLYKVIIENFDWSDPVSRDKPSKKEIQIKPNLPLEKFSILDYLGNE